MRTLPFKAVIFDMDGLLLDSERLSYQSYVAVAKRHGLTSDFGPYQQMIGLNAVDGIAILQSILPAGLGAVAFKDEWVRGYRALLEHDVPVKPFALALIEALHARGIPMAVATSSRGEKARGVLRRVGIFDKLVALTGGDEVSKAKPAPEIYLTSVAKLSAAQAQTDDAGNGGIHQLSETNLDDYIAFEDSEVGVAAAMAAGLRVIQIPDLIPAKQPESERHFIRPSLLEAAALLGLTL